MRLLKNIPFCPIPALALENKSGMDHLFLSCLGFLNKSVIEEPQV